MFINWRLREFTVTATTTTDLMPVVAGDLVACLGVQVVAAGTATAVTVAGDWTGTPTLMSSANIGITATGFKTNATSYPFLVSAAGNVELNYNTGGGSPNVRIFLAVAKAHPGPGEV